MQREVDDLARKLSLLQCKAECAERLLDRIRTDPHLVRLQKKHLFLIEELKERMDEMESRTEDSESRILRIMRNVERTLHSVGRSLAMLGGWVGLLLLVRCMK